MSAVSKFMEAFEHAACPQRPREPPKISAVLEENACSDKQRNAALESLSGPPDSVYSHSLDSGGSMPTYSVKRDAHIEQKPTLDAYYNGSRQAFRESSRKSVDFYQQSCETELLPAQTKIISGPFAGEPPTKSQILERNTLDDLFSDTESDKDNTSHNDLSCKDEHSSEHIKEAWASDGTLFSTAQPYNHTAPMRFHEDTSAADFGSTQVSAEKTSHPERPPSPMDTRLDAEDLELHSAFSEEDQIAHFSDKAFRRALREVEPSLSKKQQHYAWRNAYRAACDEQRDSDTHEVEIEDKAAAILDQNPPYQFVVAPVRYMDGLSTFGNINAPQAAEEIEDLVERINFREDDPAHGHLSHEEKDQEWQMNKSLDLNADPESTPPFNPFSFHHNLLAATAPRRDMATRERMLRSSFSQALQALEKDNAERIARESEVDEAHLQRLRTLSRRWEWAVENGDARENDDGDGRPQADSPKPAVERGSSMEAQATSPTRTDTTDVSAGPSNMNHRKSYATAIEPPDKQRSGNETMSTIQAEMAEYARAEYARVHESDEEVEPPTPRSQIPGLEHLNRPTPPHRHKTPAQPSTPPSPTSPVPFNTNIRKSIEPETPTHLLHRDCTPAFEDRSPTPSPSNGNGDGNTDVEMGEALTPANHRLQSATPESTKPAFSLPKTSPYPLSSPNPSKPYSPQASVATASTAATNQARSRSRSRSCSPLKPPVTQASTSHPSPSSANPTKQRRHPDRATTTMGGRRKSAVQGSGVKIKKPNKPTPKSRTTTRKVTVASIKSSTGAATTINPPASGNDSNNDTVHLPTGTVNIKNVNANVARPSSNKVKEAVERIEAGMLQQKDDRVRDRDNGKGSPPTRRSRRLMEKRGETPEPE